MPEFEGAEETGRAIACETRPGRIVITEDGNRDAWLAADHAVDPEQYR